MGKWAGKAWMVKLDSRCSTSSSHSSILTMAGDSCLIYLLKRSSNKLLSIENLRPRNCIVVRALVTQNQSRDNPANDQPSNLRRSKSQTHNEVTNPNVKWDLTWKRLVAVVENYWKVKESDGHFKTQHIHYLRLVTDSCGAPTYLKLLSQK